MPLIVTLANKQKLIRIDPQPLRKVVRQIACESGIPNGNISLAVVDDATIAAMHNRFLNDPHPTDVLSFVLESLPDYLEGEVVASAETAARIAPDYGWPASAELHLYLFHGVLHLVGYDDQTPRQKVLMRKKENFYLKQIGIIRGRSG